MGMAVDIRAQADRMDVYMMDLNLVDMKNIDHFTLNYPQSKRWSSHVYQVLPFHSLP